MVDQRYERVPAAANTDDDQAAQQQAFSITRKPARASDSDIELEKPIELSPAPRNSWRPIWTSRLVVAFFLATFVGMLASLELLRAVSRRNLGLASTNRSRYYLWTYGPTALLTLIAALWTRTNYRVRQMAPWIALYEASAINGSKSIGLDYVSPTQPEIIWLGLKNRHFVVAMSTFTSVLLTILIIPSTGLFGLTILPTSRLPTQFTTTSKFVPWENASSGILDSPMPLYILNAIDNHDLDYPSGTTPELAYQPFTLSQPHAEAILEAEVDALGYELDCEPAELKVNQLSFAIRKRPCQEGDLPSIDSDVSIIAGDCEISSLGSNGYAPIPYAYAGPGDTQTFARYASGNCNRNNISDPLGQRVLVLAGQARQVGDSGPPVFNCTYVANLDGVTELEELGNVTVVKSQQWICKPDSFLTRAIVSLNATQNMAGVLPKIDLALGAERRAAPSQEDMLNFFQRIIDQAIMNDTRPLPTDVNANLDRTTTAILRDHEDLSLDDFLGTDLFLNMTKSFYKRLMVQLAHQGLTTSDDTVIEGFVTSNQNRLVVQDRPLRIMEAILCLLILVTTAMIISGTSRRVLPRDGATIAGVAALLARSQAARSSFSGTAAFKEKKFQNFITGKRFRGRFHYREQADSQMIDYCISEIETTSSSDSSSVKSKASDPAVPIKWWRPFIISKRLRLPCFTIAASLIVALQLLLYHSHQHQGLVDIDPDARTESAWSLILAAVMTGVVLYTEAIASVYQTFAPYFRLRSGATAKASICANYLSLTKVEFLWASIRHWDPALCATAVSVILGTFLNTISSGVYSASAVPMSRDVSLQMTDSFSARNISDDGSLGQNGLISSLVLSSNLSYPRWTYKNLALASVNFTNAIDKPTQSTATVRAQIPAIRSSLNCTLYETSDFPNVSWAPAGLSLGGPAVRAILPGSGDCAGKDFQTIGQQPGDAAFFGAVIGNSTENCPTLNYVWGVSKSMRDVKDNSIHSLSCYEDTEQLRVEAALFSTGWDIDVTSPPRPVDNTIAPFSRPPLELPYYNMPQESMGGEGVDGSFAGILLILRYRHNITTDDLINPNRTESISAAIKELHTVARAQQYHAVLREPSHRTGSFPPIITGTLTNSQRLRLVQNTVSTHVLCGLLGAVLLCAIIASWLMSTKHVVPRNPCSVATVMSLCQTWRINGSRSYSFY